MELQHPIMSKLWDLGGGTKRQRHLIRATAIFVVDGCQFGPSSILGLKMELMACVDLVGGTMEQSYLFPDLI